MDYMTLNESSEKLNISPRMINYYCSAGCISLCRKRYKLRNSTCSSHKNERMTENDI